MMDSFVLLKYVSLAASRTLLQRLLVCLNFTLKSEDLSFWYKRKKWFLWTMAAAQAAENHGDEWGLTWYLRITSFAHVFLSTHLLFCTYSLISNRRKKYSSDTNHITPQDQTYYHLIMNYVLIISSHENFNIKYLRITFYNFFIAFWPPVPKVILVLQRGWHQIVRQDMNSHSVSYLIF